MRFICESQGVSVWNNVYVAHDRYTLDVDLKSTVTAEKLESTASRVEARKVFIFKYSNLW